SCGRRSWPSYANCTSASRGRSAPYRCSPDSAPPTKPNSHEHDITHVGSEHMVDTNTPSDAFGQGLKLLQQLGGQERPAVLDLFESLGEAAFGEQCVGFVYGGVYQRPGLSLQERQLVTVGALTPLGYAPSQLEFHAKAALNIGCTPQQIIETIVHVSTFAGFPATLDALTAVKDAFAGIEDE